MSHYYKRMRNSNVVAKKTQLQRRMSMSKKFDYNNYALSYIGRES